MTAGSVETTRPILALGLGNLLLADDGVGLRLLEDLRRAAGQHLDVEFIDGGTQGLALLGYLAERPSVLILDAVGFGASPGTVHVLENAVIGGLRVPGASTPHEGSALEVLAAARLLGQSPGYVVIVGIEPARVRTGIGLSDPVEAALPLALAEAMRILESLRSREYVPGSPG
ncbi:MAG: hydrogenase maturation protease [Acidobacteriota bacterium]|nr:hydrogenase maturation protease [Acidobacteriota bacterium]